MELARPVEIAPPTSPGAEVRRGAGRFPGTEVLLGGAVLVHLLFLVSLRTGWLNPLFNDALHRFGPGCDFFSIYAAGVKARLGEPVYPVGGHVEQVPYAYAFRYAPLVAYTLGWLLSLFPHVTAYGLWLVGCELALLRNLRLTFSPRRTPLRGTRDTERDGKGTVLTADPTPARGYPARSGTQSALRERGEELRRETLRARREQPLTEVHLDPRGYASRITHHETQDRCTVPPNSTTPSRTRVAIAAAMWLCFTPYYLELYVGQFTFITASLVFWAYLSWESSGSLLRLQKRVEKGTNLSQTHHSLAGTRPVGGRKAAKEGGKGERVGLGEAEDSETVELSDPRGSGCRVPGTPRGCGRRYTHPAPRRAEAEPADRSDSPVCGDLFWSLAVLLKMMPLLYLPIALLRRRWGAVAGTVVVLVGTSVLYFQRFPADWALFTATNGDPRPSWHAGNQGLMALLYALSGERTAIYLQYRLVALAVVGLALAWLFWKALTAEAPRTQRPAEGERGEKVEGDRQAAEGGRLSPLGTRNSEFGTRTANLQPASLSTCRTSARPQVDPYLYLYAGASAAYLLCYKDVWEHHYVLLLPPLVLMCLRGVSPWVWAPAYAVAALPWLFPLYDLPNLGYNEDPQRYWLPSVSLLHHAFKPLAALWLLLAVIVTSLRKETEFTAGPTSARGYPARTGTQSALSPAEKERMGTQYGDAEAASAAGSFTYAIRNSHYARTWARWTFVACVAAMIAIGLWKGGAWAAGAIEAQRSVSRRLVWGPELLRKQETREGCGPAALAAVCRYYGVPATEAELAKLAGTTPRGTAMLGLLKAAHAKGLAAEGRRYTLETLAAAPRPCILFYHAGHFAVLTGVQGHRFYLADPSLGARVFTPAQLRHFWRGEVLLLGPGPDLGLSARRHELARMGDTEDTRSAE